MSNTINNIDSSQNNNTKDDKPYIVINKKASDSVSKNTTLLGITIGVIIYSIYILVSRHIANDGRALVKIKNNFILLRGNIYNRTHYLSSSHVDEGNTYIHKDILLIKDYKVDKLDKGLTHNDACSLLLYKNHITSLDELHLADQKIQRDFITLGCSTKESLKNLKNLNVLNVLNPKNKNNTNNVISNDFINKILPIEKIQIIKPTLIDDHGHEYSVRCKEMRESYHVEPGSSWGSLPDDLQKQWSNLKCDSIVALDKDHGLHHEDEGHIDISKPNTEIIKKKATLPDAKESLATIDSVPATLLEALFGNIDSKNIVKKGEAAGLFSQNKDYLDWCEETKNKYEVLPMKSWGKLPGNLIDVWKTRSCDKAFTSARLGKKKLSKCLNQLNKDNELITKVNGINMPLIAVMAATTTRKVVNPQPGNMALFMYLLPSLIRTLDCGYSYEYILGFDKGDPFYDSVNGMKITKQWFAENVEFPMKENGISIKLRVVKVNNTLKKPGPVFLEMARAAYKAGAEYYYRVNDDTELLKNWPTIFVKAIHSLPLPYGVVGPRCNQGNQKILTHDFVHKTHMEIFEMNYYPAALTDWWMDDWISLVYGKSLTFKAKNTPVIHHTGAHGQRYEVDRTHEKLLMIEVEEGRKKIRNWMLKNKVSERHLKQFDNDIYKPGFTHLDVPTERPQ